MANDTAGTPDEPQSLTIPSVSDPTNGTAAVETDGMMTYTPDPDFFGSDGFSYKVCDSDRLCDTASVFVTVYAVNDPPQVSVDLATQEVQYSDSIVPVTITAVDIDSTGDELAFTTSWSEDGGSLTPGLPPGLTLTAVASNGATIPGETSWLLSGVADLASGTYMIHGYVDDQVDLITQFSLILVEIKPEDAT